jgi:hypothetical protein
LESVTRIVCLDWRLIGYVQLIYSKNLIPGRVETQRISGVAAVAVLPPARGVVNAVRVLALVTSDGSRVGSARERKLNQKRKWRSTRRHRQAYYSGWDPRVGKLWRRKRVPYSDGSAWGYKKG